ncbi:C6 transcription factor [Seiridium cupressi]
MPSPSDANSTRAVRVSHARHSWSFCFGAHGQEARSGDIRNAHRLKAIKAIKKTLAEVPKSNTFEQGNALMATCFALTLQSVMLDDGMAEYMTFIRGIIITAIQMWCKGAKFLFHDFVGEDQMALLKPLMEHLPVIKKEWTDMAVAGIRALQPLCKHPVEVEYFGFILDIAETLYTPPFAAYQILCKHYGWWMQISHKNFAHLIDPENATCALLASHWIALKQIMATITEKEYEARAQTPAQEEKGMNLETTIAEAKQQNSPQ